MKYKVAVYILIEPEDGELHDSIDDAIDEIKNQQLMQPEHIYKIMECEDNGEETGREMK